MDIYEANYYSGLSPFKTKEECEAHMKPDGFIARHPIASLAVLVSFGYAVVKLTLLWCRS